MLRSLVLGIANRSAVRRAVTGGLGRSVALRFVAGETLDEAIEVTKQLNAASLDVSLDHLGENVSDAEQARAAADVYRDSLKRIEAERLRANISVKLTQMGLDVDAALAAELTDDIVRRASDAATSVTLDMEDHRYTDRTIETCLSLAERHPGRVGLAVQAYLRRTAADLERLAMPGVHVRLCKGAYKEPRAIAYQRRREVSTSFAMLTTRLLASPAYAMIATHDEELIEHARAEITRLARAPQTFEFQMLYGVRRELQRRLVDAGYRLRLYVPFGSQWYPYLMRFFVEALARG